MSLVARSQPVVLKDYLVPVMNSLILLQEKGELLRDRISLGCEVVSSYLLYPVSKAPESFTMIKVVDLKNPGAPFLLRLAEKAAFAAEGVLYGLTGFFTVPSGLLIRAFGCSLQPKAFSHQESRPAGKVSEGKTELKILNWNICCIGGGSSITDGGVLPWHYRIDEIIKEIAAIDADVVALSETWMVSARLKTALREMGYDVCADMGRGVASLSSGMIVASKYRMRDVAFQKFSQEKACSGAEWVGKGGMTFNIEVGGETVPFCVSHMQHSDSPARPVAKEQESRKGQGKILEGMMEKAKKNASYVVLLGDLNQDPKEFREGVGENFSSGTVVSGGRVSWGGDQKCSEIKGGRDPSDACTLDYTDISPKAEEGRIRTVYRSSGFDGKQFNPKALSDHEALITTLTCGKD